MDKLSGLFDAIGKFIKLLSPAQCFFLAITIIGVLIVIGLMCGLSGAAGKTRGTVFPFFFFRDSSDDTDD